MSTHFDDERWLAFVEGDPDLDAAERKRLATHLANCAECRDHVDELREWAIIVADALFLSEIADDDDDVETAAAELAAHATASELAMQRARLRVESLNDLAADAATLVPSDDRERLALCRALIEAGRSRHTRAPADVLRILEAAETLLRPLQAIAVEVEGDLWKERAYALLQLGRFNEALHALDVADTCYATLRFPTFDRAHIAWSRGSVYFAMKEFAEARRWLDQAEATFAASGDDWRVAKVRVTKAGVLFDEGDVAAALQMFRELIPIAERHGDMEMVAGLHANIATCERQNGAIGAAAPHAAEAAARLRELGIETDAIRLRWSDAADLRASGDHEAALTRLVVVSADFEALGMTYDAATVTLEVVEILLELERNSEAEVLAARIMGLFRAAGAKVDAAHAAAALQEAIARNSDTDEAVRHLRDVIAMCNDAPDGDSSRCTTH